MRVAIVGAGVVGASVAYHLAARGIHDVVVLDRADQPGGGSTPRATGGFRVQFGTAINIALSLLAREKLLRFEEELGVDSGYRPHGYLFLARSEAALNALRIANALQHANGAPEPQLIDADEARRINPAIEDDAIAGGAYGPRDGFIRAMQIVGGYTDAAKRFGVRFDYGVEAVRWRVEGDHVIAIETRYGAIEADVFVNAAGAWASTLGIDNPVRPLRRQVACTIETDALPETMPMTIWLDDGFHLRVRDRRILLLRPDEPRTIDPFDDKLDDEWIADVVKRAKAKVPIAGSVAIDRNKCWAGLYEMSPDRHALLGRAHGFANLFLANGSSGHGVMHAPALGQLLAQLIAGEEPSIDIHPLRPSRFAEGEPIAGPELL
jgi:sarcosine oxidase subunit beta